MEEMEEKVYFNPGDLVRIKHELDVRPIMMVVKKKTDHFGEKKTLMRDGKEMIVRRPALRGIVCRWYTQDGHLEEHTFNTKDLEHVEE